jgi:hypothetical protein
MPAVESVLQLYNLDVKDGTITAFDSYGSDVHLGTSTGQLICLSVSEHGPRCCTEVEELTKKLTNEGVQRPGGDGAANAQSPIETLPPLLSNSTAENEVALPRPEGSWRTTVARRCTLSASGLAVQQIQHSRSQRVLFVLCEGRLQLLHAETYAVLCSIATNIVSFSVAQPVRCRSTKKSNNNSDSPLQSSGWRGVVSEGEVTDWRSRSLSHTRTSSEMSYGSSQQQTPRSPATYPSSPFLSRQLCKSSHVHVVCVAEKSKKELAVYAVDRVSTKMTSTAAGGGGPPRPPITPSSLSPSTTDLASGGGGISGTTHFATAGVAPTPPPRVVLLQRYVLPELAQCVIMCAPSPAVAFVPPASVSAGVGTSDRVAAVTTPAVVEAGLTVCVGMRREVSLLPLLGGVPRCVLRLDGSRPPLLSIGSDHNTYFVRTQAPNTVMEVGVPPSAAAAGLQVEATVIGKPVSPRVGYHPRVPSAPAWRGRSATPSLAFAGKDNELDMGDVFQSDAVVELVLARFPYVFLFTAAYCDVVSILGEGGSHAYMGTTRPPAASSTVQRVPIPGVRHGALRGQGKSIFVANERTVWSMQLCSLRAQLAEMVHAGCTEEAFQLLAFHQQRALSLAPENAVLQGRELPQPLALLERDLHLMAGFASLYRGDVVSAIRVFRHHLDPRELLLALPDCIPPGALSLQPPSCTMSTARAYGNDGDTIPTSSPLLPPLQVTSASTRSRSSDRCTLHYVEAEITAAEVRSFLNANESAASTGQGGSSAVPNEPTGSSTQTASTSCYWDHWSGPCAFNTCAADVSRAWRASFDAASPSIAASSDGFVASCYDSLKEEVRKWFAEDLMSATEEGGNEEGSATYGVRGESAEVNPGFATPKRRGAAGDEDGPLSLSVSTAPSSSCPDVYRRAMAYASLVLAWQARDFHTAYHVVARAGLTGLRLEDCVEVLSYLHEYRLLALLYFRAGDGEACVKTLKQHVCLSRTLLLSPLLLPPSASSSWSTENAALKQPTYVQMQLSLWCRCMEVKFSRQQGASNEEGRLTVGASCLSPTSASYADEQQELPVCGRGLLMQPSVALVTRVAQALCGIDGDSLVAPVSPECHGWGQLLSRVCDFYASGGCSRSSVGYARLHFTSPVNAHGTCFVLPHSGPLLTVGIPPPPSYVTAAQQHCSGNSASTTLARAAGVYVVPSPLSEYFYAVEKLDVRTVRQLLIQQPRLAQMRDIDGCSGLHVALAQVRAVVTRTSARCDLPSSFSAPQLHERERGAATQAAALKVICAMVGLLVHCGCPVSALSCNGWSCLDVAAVACGGDAAVFDVVTAALLASADLCKAELSST